jgi:bifunctional UDP-N-acetylglucosamine pyrophosphorylase/glucosamine-1-phosphate N-acetyltransferase
VGEIAAIILAAGKSTRMKSERPKVLHEICGRPMLSYVLNACRMAGVDRLVVVVGHGKSLVKETFSSEHDITWVEQVEQHGTGHAVLCCRDALRGLTGTVVVIAGDMPLLRREALTELIEAREENGDALTLATTLLDDPTGYGRIIRDGDGKLDRIVEDRDCNESQKAIGEVNVSYYCFDAAAMFGALDRVKPDPVKGEYYLTETVRILKADGRGVSARVRVPSEDALGINSRIDLAMVARAMQDRLQRSLVEEGVTIVDPDNTWIEADVTVGCDTTIFPFTFIGAGATIGENGRIGPFVWVRPGEVVGDGVVLGPNLGATLGSKSREGVATR